MSIAANRNFQDFGVRLKTTRCNSERLSTALIVHTLMLTGASRLAVMTINYYNCGNTTNLGEIVTTSSVRLSKDLVDQARLSAKAEFRTVQGQLEYWALVGKAALENPDLPIEFVSEALLGLNETSGVPFVPRSLESGSVIQR